MARLPTILRNRYGGAVTFLAVLTFTVGYVWLLLDLRTIGQRLEADPNLRNYAALPREEPNVADPAPVGKVNRWWRPQPRSGGEPGGFGGIVSNPTDRSLSGLHAVAHGYDRRGSPVVHEIVPCQPQTLLPGECGTYSGHYRSSTEIVQFRVLIAQNADTSSNNAPIWEGGRAQ